MNVDATKFFDSMYNDAKFLTLYNDAKFYSLIGIDAAEFSSHSFDQCDKAQYIQIRTFIRSKRLCNLVALNLS